MIKRHKYCKAQKTIGAIMPLDLIIKLFNDGLQQSSRNAGLIMGGHKNHGERENRGGR